MMNILRSKQKAIMWFLVIVITPAFIVWGVGTMGNSSGGGNVVASVNGDPIQYQEFYEQFGPRYEQTLKMYESYFGVLDKRQKESIYNSVAAEAVETVINQRVLSDYAKRSGLVVTVNEIRADLIRQLSTYNEMMTEGVFDEKKFDQWIADMPEENLARIEFETRQQLLVRKAYDSIVGNAMVTPDEVTSSYLEKNRTVTFAYASAVVADYYEKVTITDEDISAYYAANKELYRLPAKVTIDYVPVSPRESMASVDVTDEEAEAYYDKHKDEFVKDEVNVEYIRFANTEFLNKAVVTSAEVNEFYTKNKNQYNKGPRVSVETAALRISDIARTLTVTEEEKLNYYTTNKETYKRPETLRARHLLVRVLPTDSSTIKKEKKMKAEEALKEIKSGKDFIEVVKKYSDANVGDNGGDLGYFKREDMVTPFSDAAFKLKIGEFSDIVETQFGYHIIKCEDRKAEQYEALSEPAVATAVETNVKMEKARVILAEKKVELQKAMVSERVVSRLASQFGMQVQRLPLMSRDEFMLKVVRNDAHADLAYSSSVGTLLPIYSDTDSLVLVTITGNEKEYYTPVEEVRATITEKLKKDKATEMTKKYAEGFYTQLKSVSNDQFTAKAQELKLLPQQTGFFGSGYNDFIPGIGNDAMFRRYAFQLNWASIPEPVQMQDGSFVIMRLVERKDNNVPEFKTIQSAVRERVQMIKAVKKTDSIASKVKRAVSSKGFDEKVLTTYGLRVQKDQTFDEKSIPEFLMQLDTPEASEKVKKELFSAKKNTVLKPIHSGDTYYIVRITDAIPSDIQALDLVRDDVARKLRRERAFEAAKNALASEKHLTVPVMKVSDAHPLFAPEDITSIVAAKNETMLDKGAVVYHVNAIVVNNDVVKNMTDVEKKTLHDEIMGKKQEYVFTKWLEKARKDAKVKNYIQKFMHR